MRAPYLIRFTRVLSFQLMWAVLVLPSLLTAQSNEQALQYRVGEIAQDTIVAIETIRVTDTSAQGAHRRSVTQIPPIYAYQKSAFQRIEDTATEDWYAAKENYLRALERVFGKREFRNTEVNAEPFTHFINNFQSSFGGFPFNDATARRWATGSTQDNDLRRHLDTLRNFMSSYFIRADSDSFSRMRIETNVEVTSVEGGLPNEWRDIENGSFVSVPFTQFLTVTQAQTLFEKQASGTNRQMRTYLSRIIQPNTTFLESISQERWSSLPTSGSHEVIFNEGEVIVRKGETITPVIKDALDLMVVSLRFNRLKNSVKIELAREPRNPSDKNAKETSQPTNQEAPTLKPAPKPELRAPEQDRPQGKLPPILSPTTVAQTKDESTATSQTNRSEARDPIGQTLANSTGGGGNSRLASGFTRWIIALILFVVVGMLVFLHFRKSPPVYVPAEHPPALIEDRKQNLMKALASQLTQTLFRQRQELLKSKEEATAQVAAMEDRLAKLQPEIFDKLAAYEKKIKELEAQLEQQGVSKEMMDENLSDEVARPIFESINGSAEGEESIETQSSFHSEIPEEEKEVPFPGNAVVDDLDEEGPTDLLEEVMEDLEAESFEERIAKGSDR